MSENNQEVNGAKPKQDILATLNTIKRELIIGVSLLIIGAIGYGSFHYIEKRKEIKASEAYFRIKKEKGFVEDNKKLSDKTAQDAVKDFITKHAASTVAKDAALELAKYFDENKDFKSAFDVLNLIKKFNNDNLLDNLYQYRLAVSMQKNGDCKGAVSIFTNLSANRKFSYLNAPSLLQQALCYESLGDKDKAVSTYENIITTYGDTDTGKLAEKYLILIKMGA